MERDNARRTGPALERMQQFLVWLVPAVETFPRSRKFLLGDRIQSTALDVVERLIEATYSRSRRHALMAANLGIEKLRILFRLATELKALDRRRYEFAARSLDEVGRLVGGWIKTDRGRQEGADAGPA
ncbi:MAG: diversity-generating retroelement protein Avd [Alphaproteobacteria bacterium]|nr:diversity-generating retroelement protein Avd [Alphaproteobacteria bacterium]